jgi:dihydroorotase
MIFLKVRNNYMLIQNGTILSPTEHREYKADLRIEDGKITKIGQLAAHEHEKVIDASGCMVAPGLIDVHVHFRDPGFTYKEDLHTGACAAAAGGFTTVVCMANTRPAVDSPEVLQDILKRASHEKIRILQAASITKGLAGQELTDFEALAAAGACGFTDDGFPLMDDHLTALAMEKAKALNLPLSFHEEHPAFIRQSGAHATAPAVAEDLLVARDCMLALHTGAVVSIQHISSAHSVAMVRLAKSLGAHVWAEATPHHFSLTEDAVALHGTLAKMNPPLRTEEDRQAIIEGLKDGTIDLIVTDHAPHSAEEKDRPFEKAPSGIIGLETSLSLGITNLVRPGHLTMLQLMEKMSANPAALYHLPYDGITEGAAADLVIFNPEETVCHKIWQSKSSNSPFTNVPLYGAVKYTICLW